MNNVTITLSNKEMTKIKVVDLDEFYNFVVDDFFIWNHLLSQIGGKDVHAMIQLFSMYRILDQIIGEFEGQTNSTMLMPCICW